MCHGQLLSQGILKARKGHWCEACAKRIEPGRKYVRTSAVVAGDFQSSKLCLRCQALLEVYTDGDVDACYSLAELHSLVLETRDRYYGHEGRARARYAAPAWQLAVQLAREERERVASALAFDALAHRADERAKVAEEIAQACEAAKARRLAVSMTKKQVEEVEEVVEGLLRMSPRAAACVKACAGIPDPERAIAAVREALWQIANADPMHHTDPDAPGKWSEVLDDCLDAQVERARAALALLEP